MLPDRVLNPGPLTYESGALPIGLRGPAGLTGSNSPWLMVKIKSPKRWNFYDFLLSIRLQYTVLPV